jgi:hypothetical protein
VSTPVDCEPEVVFVPLQPPEAVHEVALVLDQLRVELPPEAIVAGFVERVSVGADVLCTVTRAERVDDPPAPLQVSV